MENLYNYTFCKKYTNIFPKIFCRSLMKNYNFQHTKSICTKVYSMLYSVFSVFDVIVGVSFLLNKQRVVVILALILRNVHLITFDLFICSYEVLNQFQCLCLI